MTAHFVPRGSRIDRQAQLRTIPSRRSLRGVGQRPRFRAWAEGLEPRALLATIVVTGTADTIANDGVVSLREAIVSTNGNADVNADVTAQRSGAYLAGAAGADTISVPAGTYALSIPGTAENAAATGDLDITDSLTLTGAGAATTVIDAGGIDRVFDIIGVNPVTISAVTIRNGNAGTDFEGGGGVLLTSRGVTTAYTVTLSDCVISGNTAVNGGGITNDDTVNNSLVLVRTTVSDNTASTDGAGIVFAPGTGSLTLTGCIVRDNAAGRENGGILAVADLQSDLTITDSTISGNSAPGGIGGGITWSAGTFTLANSTVSGNTAGTAGGGIITEGGNSVTLINSTISGNTAGENGGGLFNVNGPCTLTNVTITNNVADSDNNGIGNGGGIFNLSPGTIGLLNTIVGGNTDRGGQAPDCSGTITSQGHNLIQSTAGCTITGDTTGNILGQDPKLGPLADNGGPTSTQLLLDGSPAIDAGTSIGAPATDQRGITRPQKAGVDIGSVEVVAAATASADLSVAVTASPNPAQVGQDVTFTIVVTNSGPDAATGAVLVDTLPTNATFLSATGRLTPVGGHLTFNLGTLASGASTTLTVELQPTGQANEAVTDVADVASANVTDPNTANNHAGASFNLLAAPAPASADLSVAVSATPNPVGAGGDVTYAIALTNNGPDPAQSASLATTIPAGTTFVSLTLPAGWTSTTPAVGGTGAVSASESGLAPGQATFTLVVHVNPTTSGGSNLALLVQASSSTSDPVTGNNAATATVQVVQPTAPGNGPTVTNVQRFGFHMQPTHLVMTFSGPLAAAPAADPRNFLVVAHGADGKFGTRDDRIIRIISAQLDSTGSVLTLVPSRRLPFRQRFRLVVYGNGPGGLTDTGGRSLDGNGDGSPGGNFVTAITRDLLAGPVALTAKPSRRLPRGPKAHLEGAE
jgi:uncharacterized repeat protein (TIGR01451 family)